MVQINIVYMEMENIWESQTIMPILLVCVANQNIPGTYYRSGTVNSKSFIGKVLLRIKWKFKLNNTFLYCGELVKNLLRKLSAKKKYKLTITMYFTTMASYLN